MVRQSVATFRQAGAMMLGIGMLVSILGVMLFFEANLLRLGNLMVVGGVTALFGPLRTQNFFLQESRQQAAIITGLGMNCIIAGC